MKVLSIDGGGIRGLIPALVLAEVERRTRRPTAELFDLVAGTSTGGILACALTRPGADGGPAFSAEELSEVYLTEGPEIFNRSLLKRVLSVEGFLDERYEDDGLEAALERYLDDARLSGALCDLLVTAYDIKDRFAFFFRSARARSDPTYDFSLRDVARATAAAPTYFEPVEVTDTAGARTYPLIDGGVFANNPALCAYTDVMAAGGGLDVLASLGTGSQTRSYDVAAVRRWGQVQWARPVLDMVFDGVSDTIDFELGALAADRYVRLQVELRYARDDLDDASEGNLRRLRGEGERLIAERTADIEALCERLTS
ncbi:MAG TPA: patatin-like phospholipase family protein [Solirubrobacteraceae bacterium]|nr:patatin-like phospholipase family protein [Solirubrobacteraceae bacterium]